MRRPFESLVCLCVLLLVSCATTPAIPYPPLQGRWLFDYGASADTGPNLPSGFGEAISRLDREGRTEEHKTLEALAMSLQPPEILRIEYLQSVMSVRGGNSFNRDLDLSNLNPAPGVSVSWTPSKVEAKLEQESIQLTERYELSPDRTRMFITISMNAPLLEKPLEMRWTYLAAAAF